MSRCENMSQISFLMKVADTVNSNWLVEEVNNMVRVGLSTLVVASKTLSHEQYQDF